MKQTSWSRYAFAFDGFVIAIPKGNKQKFLGHAKKGDSVFMGSNAHLGALGRRRLGGRRTDFRGAVAAQDDEDVVFSWFEWPDKATRDAATVKIMGGPRVKPQSNHAFRWQARDFDGFEPIGPLGRAQLRAGPQVPFEPAAIRLLKAARGAKRLIRGLLERAP